MQKTLIHIAKAQLGLSDDIYRTLLRNRCGVESSRDLTYSQAHGLIEHLKRLGFRIRAKHSRKKPTCADICAPRKRPLPLPDNVVLMASPQQIAKLRHLRDDIVWATWNGFDLWLAKYFGIQGGIKSIRDSKTASAVIEALKGFWKSQNGCRCRLAQKGGKRRRGK
jgi:hypothetical protein